MYFERQLFFTSTLETWETPISRCCPQLGINLTITHFYSVFVKTHIFSRTKEFYASQTNSNVFSQHMQRDDFMHLCHFLAQKEHFWGIIETFTYRKGATTLLRLFFYFVSRNENKKILIYFMFIAHHSRT